MFFVVIVLRLASGSVHFVVADHEIVFLRCMFAVSTLFEANCSNVAYLANGFQCEIAFYGNNGKPE